MTSEGLVSSSSLCSVSLLCRLHQCSLTGAACTDLASVLETGPTLMELNLGDNSLGDDGVRQLCLALKKPDCKLRKLGNPLLEESLSWGKGISTEDLAPILVPQQTTFSKIQLSQGQKVRLNRCGLTVSTCKDLSSVVAANVSLTSLDLSENPLGDCGVTELCQGLLDSHCQLQSLQLHGCHLTAAACEPLSAVLASKPSLVELNLGGNPLGDPGIHIFCKGMKNPQCGLQRLK
uniref:Uncharacterized protein n=1 Tax=Anolis carolinensis TaxID=28377 RepID=A0A803TB49_ANOCA